MILAAGPLKVTVTESQQSQETDLWEAHVLVEGQGCLSVPQSSRDRSIPGFSHQACLPFRP